MDNLVEKSQDVNLLQQIAELNKKIQLFEETNYAAKIGSWEIDLKNNTIFWSNFTRKIHEVPDDYQPDLETAIGFFKDDVSHQIITKSIDEAIHQNKPYNVELKIHTYKGNELWVRATGTPEIKNGKVIRLYGTFQNIDEQKKQELALINSENKYKSLVNHSTNAFFLTKPDGTIIDANPAAQELFGYTIEEIRTLGRNGIIDTSHPNLPQLLKTRAKHGKAHGELAGIKKDGTKFPILISSAIFKDVDDQLYTSISIIDISERKQAEEDLNTSREEFLSAFHYSSIGMALVTPEGRWKKVNKSLCQMLGYTEDELHQLTFQDITHPDDLNIDLEFAKKLANREIDSYQMEKRYFTKSGETIWINLSGSRAENADGSLKHFISQIENINERKKAQEALALSESRFKGIFNSVFQFIGLLKPDGTLIEANETAMNFADLKPEDVINKKFWDCHWWTINPETQNELEKNIARAAKGESLQYEVEVLGKDDTSIIILFSLKPLFDEKGNVFAIVPEGRPIQDIVDARKSLIIKNKELEQFAYGASHDLKEPLRMIYSFMEIIKQKYAPQLDEKANKYIDFAVDGAKRMSILIDELLNYAKVGSSDQEKEIINVNQVLDDIIKLQKAIIEDKKVVIEIESLPQITGIKTVVKQLFQNLISNAIKYQEDNSSPQIKISSLENETHWQFCVADNGIGINEIHFSQIFDLFKRLHNREKYQGSGLGLAACKKIVEQHGGEIWLTSVENKGSNFYFTLKK